MRRRSGQFATALVLIVTLGLLVSGRERMQHRQTVQEAARLAHGNPYAGPDKIRKYGCYSCHTIPGVQGADGLVGPSLYGISSRVFIAGELPNTPENLTHWIQHPHAVEPHTAMPEMGVTDEDSRDIAAYLYTLR
jgi:cytochrome c